MFINNNNGQISVNFDDEMNSIVKESFIGTKKFILIGSLSFLFYFSALYTFISALYPLMVKTTGGKIG